MFEHKSEKVLPLPQFFGRLARSFALTMAIVAVALSLGVAGYHLVAGLDWLDALLEASMILTGMGPVAPLRSAGAKIFASGYALFSGMVFLSAVGILLAPIFHRFLHRFHLEEEE